MQARPTRTQKLAISLLPALTGITIPFVHLYMLNKGNLTLPLSVHLPWLTLLTAAVFGICMAIQWLVPARLRMAASFIVLTLGVFTWAESTLLIGDFGFLRGSGIEWGEWRHLLYLELGLAGILGFVYYRFRGAVLDRAVLITSILTLSALAGLYPAWQQQRGTTRSDVEYTFTPERVFDLSPERNVIIYVLDSFQSDIFAELIANEPAWKDRLAGFTYFPNATSGFAMTYASIPNLLSGKAFDNSEPFPRYLRDAMFGNSLPRVLKDQGFDSRVMSFAWQAYLADPAIVDNVTSIEGNAGRSWMQRLEFTRLANLTIFRISPYLAKPWAYNDNEFRIRNKSLSHAREVARYELREDQRRLSAGNDDWNFRFQDLMETFVTTDMEKPALRVFHLVGLHVPFKMDRDLNSVSARDHTRENILDVAAGMLELMDRQFDRLREIGAFDNSTIMLVGDHGYNRGMRIGVSEESLERLGVDVDGFRENPSIPGPYVKTGIPLMMIKPAGAVGSLQISAAPVELGDISNTVFAELGFDDAIDGPSAFDIREDAERVRIHRHYNFTGWGQDFIVPMREYEISGFSWDPGAWSSSGRDLNAIAVDAVAGTLVILGQGGNLDDFVHSGWRDPIPLGRWLGEQKVTVRIPTEPATGPRMLSIRMNTADRLDGAYSLGVSVNGDSVATFEVLHNSPATVSTLIPPSLCDDARTFDVGLELRRVGDHSDSLQMVEIRLGPPKD